MSNILIKGFYGQNNLGDDFILYSILDTLNSTGKHQVNILAAEDGGYKELFSKFPNLKCRMISQRKWRKFGKILLLLKADKWIIGGGGYGLGRIRMA